MKVKIEAAYYHDNAGNKKPIEINEISKEEYDEKYKGHLTCINNCKARIRFTQKTNGTKFFSTWNNEGELHDLDCPYHVAYKGKNGRSKLKEYYQGIKIDDEIIARRLKDWMSKFHAKQNDGYVEKSDKYNTKTISEDKEANDMTFADENGSEQGRIPNLKYKNAQFVSDDDIECIEAIWGYIDNVQLVEDKSQSIYGYFNLKTKNKTINVYFPEAFYENEDVGNVEEFKNFIKKVNRMVTDNPEQVMVIAYGAIKKKRKMGLNINVISPKRIFVDGKSYYDILKM